jgi:hypothetical protein
MRSRSVIDGRHVILNLDAAGSEHIHEVFALEPEFFRQCVYSHTQRECLLLFKGEGDDS